MVPLPTSAATEFPFVADFDAALGIDFISDEPDADVTGVEIAARSTLVDVDAEAAAVDFAFAPLLVDGTSLVGVSTSPASLLGPQPIFLLLVLS